jgi:hypothetical protein
VIFARPVRSWIDVAEIGLIALYWSPKTYVEGEPWDEPASFTLGRDTHLREDIAQGDRPLPLLLQAVAKLALGGAHGV